jgi:putative acetyltransferase
MTVLIRAEQPTDAEVIQRVLEAAFSTAAEARLVDLLRRNDQLRISLVAVADGEIVGHIGFSPIEVDGESEGGIGLAPVAVLPSCQRQGIGSGLIRAGLAECARAGYGFVVVLGSPVFYPRFGFSRADRWRLANEYGADEEFMVLELRAGAIPPRGGLVRYGPEFAEFTM